MRVGRFTCCGGWQCATGFASQRPLRRWTMELEEKESRREWEIIVGLLGSRWREALVSVCLDK